MNVHFSAIRPLPDNFSFVGRAFCLSYIAEEANKSLSDEEQILTYEDIGIGDHFFTSVYSKIQRNAVKNVIKNIFKKNPTKDFIKLVAKHCDCLDKILDKQNIQLNLCEYKNLDVNLMKKLIQFINQQSVQSTQALIHIDEFNYTTTIQF